MSQVSLSSLIFDASELRQKWLRSEAEADRLRKLCGQAARAIHILALEVSKTDAMKGVEHAELFAHLRLAAEGRE